MAALKLETFGTSRGIVLPDEALARMGVKEGDSLFLVETSNGYSLTPQDPDIAEQIEVGLKLMDRYEETFRRLAK